MTIPATQGIANSAPVSLGPGTLKNSRSDYKPLRTCCWLIALTLGAIEAWATRFTMNPDGISYLDIGDAYWRGDWHNAINAYWSPLYSWILGFFLKVLRPSSYWEYPVAHLVNFLIFVAALGCFDFFLGTFITQQKERDAYLADRGETGIPEWGWWILGYAIFTWTSLLIGTRIVTPDMSVAGFVYLDCALLLRIAHRRNIRTFVVFGIVLGFGFLAKSFLLPLGVVFLVLSALVSRKRCASLIAASVFLAIAAPFVLVISVAKHRLTFGDSGRITYAAYIDGVQPWYPGDGGEFLPEGIGHAEKIDQPSPYAAALSHPVRKIADTPATYSFDGLVVGTYPFWYDVSYWQEGIKPFLRFSGQKRVVQYSSLLGLVLIGGTSYQLLVTVGLLVLFVIAPRPSRCFKRMAEVWYLMVPAGAGLLMYALVHLEYRYIAPLICLGWIASFSGVSLPASKGLKAFVRIVVLVIAAEQVGSATVRVTREAANTSLQNPLYWRVAQALKQQGLKPGDEVALISDQPWGEGGPFVLRLLRLKVVAQVNRPSVFWAEPDAVRAGVLNAMAGTGAKGVLAWEEKSVHYGWKNLGDTNYFVYLFR